MIYNQIVTWTAFAILAMFLNKVTPLITRASGKSKNVFGLPTPHDTSLRAANLRSGRDESVLLSLPRWMSNSGTGLNLVHPCHLTSHDIFVRGDHLTFLTTSLIRSQEREVGARLCTTPVHAFPLTKLQVIVTIHSIIIFWM